MNMSKNKEIVEAMLKEAAMNGETGRLIELLEMGAPFVVDMDGQTVLHLAAISGNTETVEALLDRGCDANIQDFCGYTALQRASAGGHLEIVKLLLSHGATVDHQDEVYGNTALHEAAWKGFSRTVQLLCKKRGNVYIKNRGGFTPLHLACQNGHNQSCRNILITGCKPDIKNDYGDTPVHTAARYGHAGVIRILVSANCKISEQNKNGDTALHIAAAMGRKKLTRILLEVNINRHLVNKQGETAMDIAGRKNLQDIMMIFNTISPSNAQAATSNFNINSTTNKKSSPNGPVDLQHQYNTSTNFVSSTLTTSNNNNFSTMDMCDKIEVLAIDTIQQMTSGQAQQVHEEGCRQHNSNKWRRSSTSAGVNGGGSKQGQQADETAQKAQSRSNKHQCDCRPYLEKIGRKIEDDKRQIIGHINDRSKRLDERLAHLETKTKHQILNFHQTMKESFAEERSDCQTRMDRMSLKERIEMERQQAIRDIMLKRDIARWLQAKMLEIEKSLGSNSAPEHKAIMRKLTRRKSRREARTVLSHLRNGTLRRSNSAELISELGREDDLEATETAHFGDNDGETSDFGSGGSSQSPSGGENTGPDEDHHELGGKTTFNGGAHDQVKVYRGLRISNRPLATHNTGQQLGGGQNQTKSTEGHRRPIRTRVRHNSDGNYDDVSLMQETILAGGKQASDSGNGDNNEFSIYQNLLPAFRSVSNGSVDKELDISRASENSSSHNASRDDSISPRDKLPFEVLKIEPMHRQQQKQLQEVQAQLAQHRQQHSNSNDGGQQQRKAVSSARQLNFDNYHPTFDKYSTGGSMDDRVPRLGLPLANNNNPNSHGDRLAPSFSSSPVINDGWSFDRSTGNSHMTTFGPQHHQQHHMTSDKDDLFSHQMGRSSSAGGKSLRKMVCGHGSSDTSSIDSHNDSGYSTRMAVSEGGPSPSSLVGEDSDSKATSQVTSQGGDPLLLLDPQAVYMIPNDLMMSNGNAINSHRQDNGQKFNNSYQTAYQGQTAGYHSGLPMDNAFSQQGQKGGNLPYPVGGANQRLAYGNQQQTMAYPLSQNYPHQQQYYPAPGANTFRPAMFQSQTVEGAVVNPKSSFV